MKQSVNGLSASISSAQTTINSHTTLINQKADLTAVNDKINSAKNELNTSINKKANAVDVYTKSEVYTKTQTDSAIKVAKDSINLSVKSLEEEIANVETTVNNVQIGGRNLFKGFDDGEITLNNYQNTGSFTQFYNLAFNPADYVGRQFTISFYAKSPNGSTSLRVYNSNGSPRYFRFHTTLDTSLNTEWKYYTYTFTNTDSGSNFNASNKIEIYAPSKMGVKVKKIKIELGNKATDFTPAPEDVKTSITNAESNAVTTSKSYTDSKKTEAISTASTDATNKVNSAKNELNTAIGKKANATDVYNKTETYTKTETDSKIKIAKDEINLGVSQTYETKINVESKINTAVTSVQIGGRNLILNSKTILLNGSDNGNGNCSVVEEDYVKISPKNNGNVYNTNVYTSVDRIQGEVYTLSFDILTPTKIGFYWYPSESYSKPNYINASNKWQRISFTYEQSNADSSSTTARLFGLQGLVGGQTYKYKNLKLEKGTKATDYNEAPEDVQASIDTKANSVDVYTKTEVYTKSQTDSQINVAKDAINLGVSQTYETKSNVSSQVTSTLNSAKSYADAKKTEAITTAASDATNKANNAKNEAITSANNTLTTTIANYYTKAQTDSQINVAKNAITSSVSSTYETKTDSTTKYDTATAIAKAMNSGKIIHEDIAFRNGNNGLSLYYETKTDSTTKYDTATAIAKAMNSGKIIHEDIAFRNGNNGLSLYNNAGNGNVKVERITKPSDCPTTSTHCMRVTTTGTASPGWGGFYQGISSRANAVFIQKIVAKVPTGYQLNVASNSMGTGYIDKWLTSNKGTGKWETYIRQVTCGSSGTFSGGGHVYASGGATPTASAPLVWYVASCTVIDITDTDERVSSLATRMSTAESKITDTAITNVVKQNFYTKSETDKQITSKGYQTSSQVQQTVDGLQIKFSQSGGYNLIRNSTGYNETNLWTGTATLGTGINTAIGSACDKFMYLDNGTTTSERFAYSSRFKLKPSTTYTLTGWFNNYTKCPSFDVYVLSSTSVDSSNTGLSNTHAHYLIQAQNTNGSWKKYTVSFTTPSGCKSGIVRIDNNGYNANGSNSNRIHWSALILTEGALEVPWSPHPDEVYDGLTFIDKEGITVTASNVRSKTKMSADGFQLIRTTDNKKLFYVNQDGSLEMSGNFTQYDTNGKISIKIANNSYGCYDWLWDGDFVGIS